MKYNCLICGEELKYNIYKNCWTCEKGSGIVYSDEMLNSLNGGDGKTYEDWERIIE